MSLRSVTRPGNVVQRSSLWPRTQRLGTRRALAPPPNLSLPGNYRVTCHCVQSHDTAYHRIPSHTIRSHVTAVSHATSRTIAYHRIPSHPTFIHPSSHSNQSCNSFSPFFILTIFNLRDIHDNNHHTGERSSAQ